MILVAIVAFGVIKKSGIIIKLQLQHHYIVIHGKYKMVPNVLCH